MLAPPASGPPMVGPDLVGDRGQPDSGHAPHSGLLEDLAHRAGEWVLPPLDLALGQRPVVEARPVHEQDLSGFAGPRHHTARRPDRAGRSGVSVVYRIHSVSLRREAAFHAAGNADLAARTAARSRSKSRPA